MKITLNQISNIEVDGVDPRDYPDFCDAYVSYCEVDGREATEEELYYINDEFPELAQEYAFEHCVCMADFEYNNER
jgi:hypothetical protein